jgi:hypothetical protein
MQMAGNKECSDSDSALGEQGARGAGVSKRSSQQQGNWEQH